ncbi:MAG: glycosyltransferase [Variibacter sp.]
MNDPQRAGAAPTPRSATAPELTVVVPTFKERANVPLVVEKVATALAGVNWEIVFVDDDSPDGTADAAKAIGENDARVRCIRRVGRRGLAGACIEGMLASGAAYVAVMDADLQHDETLLAAMLRHLRGGDCDIVIGSRYLAQAEANADGLSETRLRGSRVATMLTRRLLHVDVTDPMSGFFMLRRDAFDRLAERLSTQGFKILADILASADGKLRVRELPYGFRTRLHGESKLDNQVALDFLGLLVTKLTGNALPVRFVSFVMVGAIGVGVHLLTLKVGLSVLDLGFAPAQTLATFVAMTSNFFLNNAATYRDQRLHGAAIVKGLLTFYVICAIGALSNIGVATWLYTSEPVWWLAGLLGSFVGAVWNYSISGLLVWKQR